MTYLLAGVGLVCYNPHYVHWSMISTLITKEEKLLKKNPVPCIKSCVCPKMQSKLSEEKMGKQPVQICCPWIANIKVVNHKINHINKNPSSNNKAIKKSIRCGHLSTGMSDFFIHWSVSSSSSMTLVSCMCLGEVQLLTRDGICCCCWIEVCSRLIRSASWTEVADDLADNSSTHFESLSISSRDTCLLYNRTKHQLSYVYFDFFCFVLCHPLF